MITRVTRCLCAALNILITAGDEMKFVSASAAALLSYNFSGPLPYTALDFFTIPFFVPDGIAEIQVDHRQTAVNTTNILDWGVANANGDFVGWGGGNSEPAVVGVAATSRSHNLLPSSVNGSFLASGNWSVVVGKPRIATPPGFYSVNVTLRPTSTLPAQPQRTAYVQAPPLRYPPAGQDLVWYAGDFHVHSCESGDAFANATLDEIASFASGVGLDFVHFSEHNTVSTSSFLVDAQSRHSNILLLPGVEFTTYHGHGGALFTSSFVDFRMGLPGVNITAAVDAIQTQGGLFSINHMDIYEPDSNGDMRNGCVGCAWDFGGALSAGLVNAIEIGVQSWSGTGWLFSPQAIEHWDHQHALGYTQLAPIGGSDDHHGGQEEQTVGDWHVGSAIGSPTTMVLAANLSHAAIRAGVLLGRTVVKMFNSQDPMVDLTAAVASSTAAGTGHAAPDALGQTHQACSAIQTAGPHGSGRARSLRAAATSSDGHTACAVVDSPLVRVGGTVAVQSARSQVELTATVTLPAATAAARGSRRATASTGPFIVALVRNNEQTFVANVTAGPAEPFVFNVTVPVPIAGTDRWRAEVHDATTGALHTITNHIFVPAPPSQ